MHSTGVTTASLIVAATSVVGVSFPIAWTTALLAASVVLIGVPHGAMDHWTGRKLFERRWPNTWAWLFFPGYLAVALVFTAGWFLIPSATAILFFLISAWHFGLEDDRHLLRGSFIDHIAATAVGGLVIWVSVLCQPQQVEAVLCAIVPASLASSVAPIVLVSQVIGCGMIPIAIATIIRDLLNRYTASATRNLAFILLFAVADVLISFGIYFCAWHSVRGLHRLASQHRLGPLQLVFAVAPLTMGAVLLAALGMWAWSSGLTVPAAIERTLFVALSAMAVPHLLLHGPISQLVQSSSQRGGRHLLPVEAMS